MTLTKKRRKSIVVNDVKYLFIDSLNGRNRCNSDSLTLAVTGKKEENQLLLFKYPWLNYYVIKTASGLFDVDRYGRSAFNLIPKSFVAEVIKHYLSEGIWRPNEKGKAVHSHLQINEGVGYFRNGPITTKN